MQNNNKNYNNVKEIIYWRIFMKKSFFISGIVSTILFLVVAFSYKTQQITNFDQWMEKIFYGNEVITFFHYFGETKWIFVVCVVTIILLLIKKQYSRINFIISSVGGGFFINQIVKKIAKRPRPEIPDQLSTFSFPSGHAMLGLLYIFTLCFLLTEQMKNRKMAYFVWAIGIILTFFIGLSRVAESRHFASDVLAGWFLGFTWFLFCVYVYKKTKNK